MGKRKKRAKKTARTGAKTRTQGAAWQWVVVVALGVGIGMVLGIQLVKKPAPAASSTPGPAARSQTSRSTPTRPASPLASPNPRVRMAYAFAMERPDVLAYMPCYCGCDRIGHVSSRDCFIHNIDAAGNITLSNHAVQCNICLSIALDSKLLLSQGRSLREIRQYIDRAYGAMGQGTPTPMPQ